MKKRVLLTGGSGFLGGNFCHFFSSEFEIHTTYNAHPVNFNGVHSYQADLTLKAETESLFNTVKPDVVLHFAALSDPNLCQQNPQLSYQQNVIAAKHLAEIASAAKIPFVFTSTDLIFDGENAPYKETDQPKPVNIYGRHKAEAEQVVLQTHNKALICRLPLLYGNSYSHGVSFLQPVLNKLRNNESVHLFTDEYRTIASAVDVCEGILLLIENEQNGIFHLSGNERLSRFEMGKIICSIYGYPEKYLVPSLQKDVKMPAPRPRDVSMLNNKIKKLGWQPGNFADELKKLLI